MWWMIGANQEISFRKLCGGMPYSAVRLFMVGSAILIADLPLRLLAGQERSISPTILWQVIT
jgi:hypothetical protein